MDLESFVKETLLAIVKGAAAAQNSPDRGSAKIAPLSVRALGHAQNYVEASVEAEKLVKEVEFDVAITITDDSTHGGKVGVLGGIIGAGVEGASGTSKSTATRIKFCIPIAFQGQR